MRKEDQWMIGYDWLLLLYPWLQYILFDHIHFTVDILSVLLNHSFVAKWQNKLDFCQAVIFWRLASTRYNRITLLIWKLKLC